MPAGRKRNIKAKSLKSLRNQRYHTKKRKINNTPIIVEDQQRDGDCVIVENIQNKQQLHNNKFHVQDESIYLTYNGDDFKFIDVPGDGDCFYHSVLNYGSL